MLIKASHFTDLYPSTITRPANGNTYVVGDVVADDDGSIFVWGSPLLSQSFEGIVDDAVLRADSSNDGRSVVIEKFTLVSSANQSSLYPDVTIFLFASDPGVGNGNFVDADPFAITDAELIQNGGKHCLGFIRVPATAWVGGIVTAGAGGNAMAIVQPFLVLNFPAITATYTGQVWGVPRINNAYVPVSGEAWTGTISPAKD